MPHMCVELLGDSGGGSSGRSLSSGHVEASRQSIDQEIRERRGMSSPSRNERAMQDGSAIKALQF